MTNTESQTNQKKNFKPALAAVLGAALVFFIVSFVVDQRLSELQLETKLLISEQETLLATIAETTARNGADEITERIIRDCSNAERTQFDQLLGGLNNGLNRTQLVELERLFGRCGNFFAERKSVMVARLNREIEIYETFVNQLNNLTNADNLEEYQVAEWRELSELETKQSELFSQLVAVQDEIITLLLKGNSPASEEVAAVLGEASQIQETLIVTEAQATNIRSTLVSL